MDKFFKVAVLNQTPNPQQVIAAAMHQDYCENAVIDEIEDGSFLLTEKQAGDRAVKRLLSGGRGHYGCYFEDTEVLTDKGFVSWGEVLGAQDTFEEYRLAAISVDSGIVQFEYPSKLYTYDIENEPLYEVKGRYINQLVTADHRMPISTRTKLGWSDWKFDQARNIAGKAVRYRLNGNIQAGNNYGLPTEWLKLAGFYFGDGITITSQNPSCVRFKLQKQTKIDWLYGLGFTVVKGKGDRYTVHHAGLATWLKEQWHDKNKKCIPDWIIKSDDSSFHALMEGLKASDGTCKKPHGFSFDNTNKSAIDIIQAAAAVHGVQGNITLNTPSKMKSHQDCWRIHFNYERHYCRVETQQKGRTQQTTERWINKTGKIYCATVSTGALVVRREGIVSVSGNCLEHPQIVFNCCYFPHSVMQQIRTHRVGVSFDVQSGRYTGKRIVDVAHGRKSVEEVFYARPVGYYTNRQGAKYFYSEEMRQHDLQFFQEGANRYAHRIDQGVAEEHARGFTGFDVRQHFVMSCNARSLMHLLDLRLKKDAQLECQQLCEKIYPHFEAWVPQIAAWYSENRLHKGKLAP